MGSISHLPSQKRLRLILFGRRQLASLQRRPSLNPFSIRQSQCLASLSLACDRHFLKAWFSVSTEKQELMAQAARFSRTSPDRKSTRLNSSHLVISYAV